MKRIAIALAAVGLAFAGSVAAQKKYDTGASDTEILIGQTMPYSGPASAYGSLGRTMVGYFNKINDQGGVNGRKIRIISLDDGYVPAKTLENTRRLVEQDEVLVVTGSVGTPTNSAVHTYLNQKKVPQLFVNTGAGKWNDPKNFPWTTGWSPTYPLEGRVFAEHILRTNPNAKIAILYQNDDYGKDYLKGMQDGLGDKFKTMVIKQLSYEVTDPTIDSQMVELKSSGADIFFNVTTPKFAAQAIKKAAEIGWKPTHYLNSVSNSAGAVMNTAGADNGIGILSVYYLKDPTDAQWQNTPEYKEWLTFMQKYCPSCDLKDNLNVFGYSTAQTFVQVLKQCGDNLTRENLMKQAASLDMTLPMLLPGVNVKTGPDDFAPIEREQIVTWNGKTWLLSGKTLGR